MSNKKNNKNGNKKQGKVVVNVNASRVVKKSKRARVRGGHHYARALMYPFSKVSDGCRIPDGHSMHTSTFILSRRFGVVTNPSGAFDLTILPCLSTAAFSTRTSIGGGVGLALADTSTAAGLHYPFTSTTCTGVGFPSNELSTAYSRYRIVSYGVRFRGKQAITGSGEVISAVMPLKGQAPPLSTTIPATVDPSGALISMNSYLEANGPRSTMERYLATLGLPYSGADNSATVNYSLLPNVPVHAHASYAEVAARGLHYRAMPFESNHRQFKQMSAVSLGTDSIDLSGTSSSNTSFAQQAVNLDFIRVDGLESVVLCGEGFPATTDIGSIELVYHIEAVPNPNIATLARPTGVNVPVSTGNTVDVENALAHRQPRISFADIITQVGDSLLGEIEGRAGKALSGVASSLAGSLGRMVLGAL